MQKSLIIFLLIFPVLAKAQNDLLVLKKRNGAHVRTYTPGSVISVKTVYDQWLSGTITQMRHDTIWINGLGFDYKEIAEIRRSTTAFWNTTLPFGMIGSGAGIFILGAFNGAYRHDQAKDWYTKSGVITGAGLLVGGFILTRFHGKSYRIGRRFKLDYLQITFDKKGKTVILQP